MSDLPKIYAHCKSGCEWETVHRDEYERMAAFIPVPSAGFIDGTPSPLVDVNPDAEYKIGETYYTEDFVIASSGDKALFSIYGGCSTIDQNTKPLSNAMFIISTDDIHTDHIEFRILEKNIVDGYNAGTIRFQIYCEVNGKKEYFTTPEHSSSNQYWWIGNSKYSPKEVYRWNKSARLKAEGEKVFIRYSANADGEGFTETWTAGQSYLGIATGQTAPTNKSGYEWVRVPPTGEAAVEKIETVVDGYSTDNDRTSAPYWSPFILDEATHGHSKYKNKNIVAIKMDVAQAGTLSVGRIKTIDYTSGTFSEELIVEKIVLNIENTGEQTIDLPTPIKVNSGEDLFIGHTTDTAKIKYGNTEKDQGFFYKVNGGITFVDQSVSLGVSVFSSSVEFQETSIYQGKKLSILGDSISTFNGYISSGNEAWYPTGSITDVEQTWWKKVLATLGMTLDTNNSWSGSCVGYVRNGKSSGHSDARCKNLGNPDVVIVWMGVNDFVYAGTDLGTYDGTTALPADPEDQTASMDFCSAYAVMLNKILSTYPTAEVWVCTLPTTDFSAIGNDSVFPKKNNNNNSILDYNNAIKKIAEAFSVNVIELDKCGITWQNLGSFTDDKLHPNVNGHLKIAEKVVKTLDPNASNRV